LLNQTLTYGGFPEILMLDNKNLFSDILVNYAKTIVLQDIAPRLSIRKPLQLEALFQYLATNISAHISYHKLCVYFSLTDKSIKEYIQAFSDAYLIFELEKFSYSLKTNQKTTKKTYIVDNGLANACGFKFSHNHGKLLENIVYIDCKHRNLPVFFYKTAHNLEIDFIIKDKTNLTPLQVAWQINDLDTFNREITALSIALDELKLKEGFLITHDNTIRKKSPDPRIQIIPTYQWLLR
jgi:predicted AAA+ superfamily ATPase